MTGDRRVHVLICATGQRVELDGLAAALVALVATRSVGPRSLAALCQWVANEPEVGAIAYGQVQVDLTPGRAKLYRRDPVARRPVGFPQETSDVA